MLFSLYRSLLHLYPESYQAKYGTPMLQTMEDILSNTPKSYARKLFLLKEIIATPLNACEQYLVLYSKNKGVSSTTVATLIALALLLPFLFALIADEISELLTGNHLYTSWLWSTPVLFIWIVLLPFISLALSISIYVISLVRQKKKNHKINLLAKRYWLVIFTIIISLGILGLVVFHDSVHCWFSSTSLNKVVTCTEQNILTIDRH